MSTVTVKRLTPVVIVDAIEPCLSLWVDRLGWARKAEVPHEGSLGFVILEKDGVELMYQTWASVEADVGHTKGARTGGSVGLFFEVTDLDAIERQLGDLPRAVPRRRTFYGMDEVGVTEAGGHTVIFAQPVSDA